VEALRVLVRKLREVGAAQQRGIVEQNARIAELGQWLSKDSSTSGKPLSSD
jgi:hypothetical protein